MKNYPIVLLFIFALISCCNYTSHNYEEIVIDPNKVVNELDLGTIVDDSQFSLVALETNEQSIIGELSTIKIFNNKIYVGDYALHAVFEFSLDGRFLRKLSKVGRAREEYLSLSDFAINEMNNQLIVLDHISGKCNFYDIENFEFKGSKNIQNTIWGNEIATINGKLMFINPGSKTNSGCYRLFADNNNQFSPHLPFDERERKMGWDFDRHHCNIGNSLLLYFSPMDSIYLFDGQNCYVKYVVNFTSNKVPTHILEQDPIEALRYINKHKTIGGINNVQQLGDYLMIGFNFELPHYTFYSKTTKNTVTYKDVVLESFGKFPIGNYERHKDYFISHLSAPSFQLIFSDNIIESRNASFRDQATKAHILGIRNKLTSTDNPVLLIGNLQ